jgi:hypothetical protein
MSIPDTNSRPLTPGECALTTSVFGDAIDTHRVTVRRAKFWMLQPAWITMAPDGNLWFHPNGQGWSADFANEQMYARAHFIHEMTHVWQHQSGVNLILARPPWARYRYQLTGGKPFAAYGIEQQASIVEDAYLLREGRQLVGRAALADYANVLPFGDWRV